MVDTLNQLKLLISKDEKLIAYYLIRRKDIIEVYPTIKSFPCILWSIESGFVLFFGIRI
jgi:hypothetical protein